MILQLQDPSIHFLTYEEGRYVLPFKDQADIFFTYQEGKYFLYVTRTEIFHHDWAEIFVLANMSAEIFISKKYHAPPPLKVAP